VVTSRLERVRKASENASTVVLDRGRATVHEALGPNDMPAESLTDGLVTETYTKDWNFSADGIDSGETNAGLVWGARTRGQHYPVRLFFEDSVWRDLIVLDDANRRAELAQVLDEVVRERVVVIDDEQRGHRCDDSAGRERPALKRHSPTLRTLSPLQKSRADPRAHV
jgi:hypothetical protein